MPAASLLRRTGFFATLATGIALVAASSHGLAGVAKGLQVASAGPQPGLVAGPPADGPAARVAWETRPGGAGCPPPTPAADAARL